MGFRVIQGPTERSAGPMPEANRLRDEMPRRGGEAAVASAQRQDLVPLPKIVNNSDDALVNVPINIT